MLSVKTPFEVCECIHNNFSAGLPAETVSLRDAYGRILSESIVATEYVPGFHRSTVDGYALRSEDTFGCSDSIPALLPLAFRVQMGSDCLRALSPGECAYVPTGGAVPNGADAVVMQEYSERFGNDLIGITKPAAPGMNMIFKGDDVFPGKTVLSKGHVLSAQDIGSLAALGITEVPVVCKPKVGIISTGDELVAPSETPAPGQIRDVNSALLSALCEQSGATAVNYGIFPDAEEKIGKAVDRALEECDVLLISGGSSVGEKDAACRILQERGEILFHGIAMKPGKPAILAKVGNKGVWGLPGHPVAANFVFCLFVRPMLQHLAGSEYRPRFTFATLSETVNANHGRAEYLGVHLIQNSNGLTAVPVRGKSGLISTLAETDGYLCVERDREGIPAGETVAVYYY